MSGESQLPKIQSTDDLERWANTVEEFKKMVEKRLLKLEATDELHGEGLNQVCHTLELNGLMKAGEPVKTQATAIFKAKAPKTTVEKILFDVDKVIWNEPYDSPEKGLTWYADAEKNKANDDFKRMWETMVKAKEVKGNPEPFYF